MLKYVPVLLSLLAAPAWAGSISIDLSRDFAKVFATPSGNVLCGGNPIRKADAKPDTNDLYCLVYQNQAMPKNCKAQGQGLEFVLNARGKAAMSCAGFEFEPYNEGQARTRIVNYGETVRGQGWECRSETSGLTCRNSEGRGFRVNRSRYEWF